MTSDARPVLWCFVARQLTAQTWTGLKLVPLDVAADLHAQGWVVVGPDPQGEMCLADWERGQRALKGDDDEDDAA